MDSDTYVCPVCGQPVEAVVRRHKTLGAWVPVRAPGPCRNPECAADSGADARAAGARPDAARHSRGATMENP
ncbi:hypothetical protein EV562_105296 [Streptomyces sp. BK208]|uniref:hypothetical protein n=1 Tax=Streptomyces sp. BK208 TaxID=2512150 RepID=UPI00105D504D|nr:hypothetical protein [Streptomyces sp. BK208]TDT38279.1 hypothetical protein EV562_105296 [Streptomyces sp. BK208]